MDGNRDKGMTMQIHVIRNDARVRLAQETNRKSALQTALLLLPERFTDEELFLTITGLSYTGIIGLF